MKELFEILQNFSKNKDNMDYNEDFCLIKTTMIHCNENLKNFSKIEFRGGYEPYIEEILLKLLKILRSKGYTFNINEHDQNHSEELRKITLFLILNTKCTLKFDLLEDPNVCHLINNYPPATKCLLLNLIWGMNLNEYYYDFLKYSPCWMVLEFLEETFNSLKYGKPYDILSQLENIVQSIYINICRMDYRKTSNDTDTKNYLSAFQEHAQIILLEFHTATDEALFKKKTERYKFFGYTMKSLIGLILNCFALYKNKPKFLVDKKFNIFKLVAEKEPEVDNHSDFYSSEVDSCLKLINLALLNTLQSCVMDVTIDMWVDWVEYDAPGKEFDGETTLQKIIGEMAYKLTKLINENECFQHDVVKQLETLASKPKELQEIIKEATIGTLLTKIECDESKLLWFNELLERGECVYGNLECLEAIFDNIDFLTIDSVKTIIQEYKKCELQEEELEKIHEILQKSFEKFDKQDLLKLCSDLLELYGAEEFHLDYEEDDLVLENINFQNRFTEAILTENYATIIIKNPKFFYKRLLAGLEDNDQKQNEIIIQILKETRQLNQFFIQKYLEDSICGLSKADSKVPQFLATIFKENLIERQIFMKEILVKQIGEALKNENYELILILVSTLKCLIGKMNAESSLVPLLVVVLSTVLDQSRWDLIKYTQLLDSIVETTIFVLQELIKIVNVNGTLEDKKWILEKVKDCKSLTKYYYHKLEGEKDERKMNFDEYLHPQDFKEVSRQKIVAFLCENFVRCTSKESKWLALNPTLHPYFTDCLRVVTTIVAKAGNQGNPINCLRKCILDFLKILKDTIIPSTTDKNQLKTICQDTLKLYQMWPKNIFGELTITFAEIIQEFALKIEGEENSKNYELFLETLESAELKKIAAEYLSELKSQHE